MHQENIEKIEHVQDWCRKLQILLLQSNLISKIENLGKLKLLEYLNLAVNNIERIENLDKLESLNKLDLTLNFIGDLESLHSLKENYNLRELILTGNPCSDFPHYRTYVIATLPHLTTLDCQPITTSDRLRAQLHYPKILPEIKKSQNEYKIFRELQKVRVKSELEASRQAMDSISDPQERNKFFWDAKCEHSPETRCAIAEQQIKTEKDSGKEREVERKRPLFTTEGRPYNINEAKLDFKFHDLNDRFELDLFVPKFCDTELIKLDLETNYVRLELKGKLFQLALREEIKIHESSSQRSQITGSLLVRMPKVNYDQHRITAIEAKTIDKQNEKNKSANNNR